MTAQILEFRPRKPVESVLRIAIGQDGAKITYPVIRTEYERRQFAQAIRGASSEILQRAIGLRLNDSVSRQATLSIRVLPTGYGMSLEGGLCGGGIRGILEALVSAAAELAVA